MILESVYYFLSNVQVNVQDLIDVNAYISKVNFKLSVLSDPLRVKYHQTAKYDYMILHQVCLNWESSMLCL